MHASGGLRWYLASLLWFFAVREWYLAEGTTLRYDRNIGNDRKTVPPDRYDQAISGDKEVVYGTTHWPSADDTMVIHEVIHENSTQLKTIMRYNGTAIPRSTTSSYYQDRRIRKEVVPKQNSTSPATLSNQRVIDVERLPVPAVPSDRYDQAISGDKEVVHRETLVYGTTHRPSGYDRMVIHENSTELKDTTMRYTGTTIPRSTTSSYYQERSIGKEVVPEQNDTAPATLPNQRVIDDKRLPVQVPTDRGKGERDVKEKKSGTKNTEAEEGTGFKRQDVIKGTTFEYRSNDLLEGTTELGEREIADNGNAGEMFNVTIKNVVQPSNNATSQDAPVSGRKMKMPRPNSQTMQYLLVPGFLMAGILPWVMPKLQMVVMMLSMVNNMAFTSALFTLIRNFIFERESAQHVLYINNGYKKKNRHRNNGKPHKEHQGHAPIHYEHQEYHDHSPGSDHYEHSASQDQSHAPIHYEHQEYHGHPPSLDHHGHSVSQAHDEDQGYAPIHHEHQDYHKHPQGLEHHGHSGSQVHHEYQELQEHPPIGWKGQGFSKFSEKWRRSSNTS